MKQKTVESHGGFGLWWGLGAGGNYVHVTMNMAQLPPTIIGKNRVNYDVTNDHLTLSYN